MGDADNPGVIPLTMKEVFSTIENVIIILVTSTGRDIWRVRMPGSDLIVRNVYHNSGVDCTCCREICDVSFIFYRTKHALYQTRH